MSSIPPCTTRSPAFRSHPDHGSVGGSRSTHYGHGQGHAHTYTQSHGQSRTHLRAHNAQPQHHHHRQETRHTPSLTMIQDTAHSAAVSPIASQKVRSRVYQEDQAGSATFEECWSASRDEGRGHSGMWGEGWYTTQTRPVEGTNFVMGDNQTESSPSPRSPKSPRSPASPRSPWSSRDEHAGNYLGFGLDAGRDGKRGVREGGNGIAPEHATFTTVKRAERLEQEYRANATASSPLAHPGDVINYDSLDLDDSPPTVPSPKEISTSSDRPRPSVFLEPTSRSSSFASAQERAPVRPETTGAAMPSVFPFMDRKSQVLEREGSMSPGRVVDCLSRIGDELAHVTQQSHSAAASRGSSFARMTRWREHDRDEPPSSSSSGQNSPGGPGRDRIMPMVSTESPTRKSNRPTDDDADMRRERRKVTQTRQGGYLPEIGRRQRADAAKRVGMSSDLAAKGSDATRSRSTEGTRPASSPRRPHGPVAAVDATAEHESARHQAQLAYQRSTVPSDRKSNRHVRHAEGFSFFESDCTNSISDEPGIIHAGRTDAAGNLAREVNDISSNVSPSPCRSETNSDRRRCQGSPMKLVDASQDGNSTTRPGGNERITSEYFPSQFQAVEPHHISGVSGCVCADFLGSAGDVAPLYSESSSDGIDQSHRNSRDGNGTPISVNGDPSVALDFAQSVHAVDDKNLPSVPLFAYNASNKEEEEHRARLTAACEGLSSLCSQYHGSVYSKLKYGERGAPVAYCPLTIVAPQHVAKIMAAQAVYETQLFASSDDSLDSLVSSTYTTATETSSDSMDLVTPSTSMISPTPDRQRSLDVGVNPIPKSELQAREMYRIMPSKTDPQSLIEPQNLLEEEGLDGTAAEIDVRLNSHPGYVSQEELAASLREAMHANIRPAFPAHVGLPTTHTSSITGRLSFNPTQDSATRTAKTSNTHPINISTLLPSEVLPCLPKLLDTRAAYRNPGRHGRTPLLLPASAEVFNRINLADRLGKPMPYQDEEAMRAARMESGIGNMLLSSCPGKKVRLNGPVKGRGAICRDLGSDLRRIKSMGVGCIVCCLDDNELRYLGVPWEDYIAAACAVELSVVRIPMPEGLTPASMIAFDAHIEKVIRRFTLRGVNVLAHCRGGVGRAGLTACAWAIKLGIAGPSPAVEEQLQAMKQDQEIGGVLVPKLSSAERENARVMSSVERVISLTRSRRSVKAIETFEQVNFLASYVAWLRRESGVAEADELCRIGAGQGF